MKARELIVTHVLIAAARTIELSMIAIFSDKGLAASRTHMFHAWMFLDLVFHSSTDRSHHHALAQVLLHPLILSTLGNLQVAKLETNRVKLAR